MDKWLNPDYVHACTACIDPREKRKTVPCPKLGGALVRNMGPTVMRMEILPDYIQKGGTRKCHSQLAPPLTKAAIIYSRESLTQRRESPARSSNTRRFTDQANQSDALMNYLNQQTDPVTGKQIIPDSALKDYMNHSMRQRAFAAGGIQSGMQLANTLQKLGYANREALGRTNLYQAQATKAYADAADTAANPGGADSGKIWCDVLNGYSTPTQCNNARLKTTTGQLQQNYGLKPDDLFNSAIHEAGTVAVNPTTGAKTFNPDPNGDNIRIGARNAPDAVRLIPTRACLCQWGSLIFTNASSA